MDPIFNEVETVLRTLLNNLLKENSHPLVDKEDNVTSDFSGILNFASMLIEKLQPDFDDPIDRYSWMVNYVHVHDRNEDPILYQQALITCNQHDYHTRFNSLDNIKKIDETEQDDLQLAILIQFLGNLSHLRDYCENPNANVNTSVLTKPSYEMKNRLIKHLKEQYPERTFAIETDRPNAKVSFFLHINSLERFTKPEVLKTLNNDNIKDFSYFLSWHSKDEELLNPHSELPESFYIMAEKVLKHHVPEFSNKKSFNRKDIKNKFFNLRLNVTLDSAIKDALNLNNAKTIETLIRDESSYKIDRFKRPQLYKDTKYNSEFTGGGIYEEKAPNVPEEAIVSTNIKPDNLPETIHKNSEEIWENIKNSDNDVIRKLLPLLDSNAFHNGFELSKIFEMEILQTAFDMKKILPEEFESQQYDILSSIISSSKKKDRIEIKSCGETSKKKNTGDFFIIRIQDDLGSKPLFYKLSGKIKSKLQESYPDIKLSSGKAIHSIENLEILGKLSRKKNNVRKTTTVEKEELENLAENHQTSLPQFTAKDLDDFLSQKDSMERLRIALKNTTPEIKALLAAIIEQSVPGSILPSKAETKSRRNGGLAHE